MGDMIYNDAEITDASNVLGLHDEDSTPGDNQVTPIVKLDSDNDIGDEAPGTPGNEDNPNDETIMILHQLWLVKSLILPLDKVIVVMLTQVHFILEILRLYC